MPRSGLKVPGGGGVESKFSVQFRPKLNNNIPLGKPSKRKMYRKCGKNTITFMNPPLG